MARVAEWVFFLLGVFCFAAMFQKPRSEFRIPEGNPFRDNKYADYLYGQTAKAGGRGCLFFISVIFLTMGLATKLAIDVH